MAVEEPPKKKFSVVSEDSTDEEKLDAKPESYEAFRVDSQVRPSNALLDFWKSNGSQRAIAYNHLYDIAFSSKEGLVLTFSEHIITLKGHCLKNRLYDQLKRHRVVWIWEALPQEAKLAGDTDTVVTEIKIEPRFQEQP